MITTIVEHFARSDTLTIDELFKQMKSHDEFDAEKFWRFNPNRLNQLLIQHTIKYPEQDSIATIYKYRKI